MHTFFALSIALAPDREYTLSQRVQGDVAQRILRTTFVTSGDGSPDPQSRVEDGLFGDDVWLCESAGGRCVGEAFGDELPVTFGGLHRTARDTQHTAQGRALRGLTPYQSVLYLGYGDTAANTGPVTLAYVDPASSVVTDDIDANGATFWLSSEAVDLYRIIDGNLVAPAIDPIHHALAVRTETRGFVATGLDGFGGIHVYDVAAYGGAWYAAGSSGSLRAGYPGAVWRSTDEGATFQTISTRSLGIISALRGNYPRNHLLFAYRDRLWTQTAVRGDPDVAPRTCDIYDGAAFSAGIDLLPAGATGYRAQNVAGRVSYLSHQPTADPSRWLLFDGQAVSEPLGEGARVWDVAVTGDDLYVLTYEGVVERFTGADITDRKRLGIAPPRARSIAVLDGELWFGTLDSTLARTPLP